MPNAIHVGTVVKDRYKIERRLGEGGMGTVFHAIDLKLDRPVALKVPRPLVKQYSVPEAKAVARLQHPNTVQVYDYIADLDVIVMEYIEGSSLADVVRKGQPTTLDQCCSLLHQIASALDYAHANGVVHRDIKPANVLIRTSDNSARVCDFGLAKFVGVGQNSPTQLSAPGTPGYMAPEYIRDGKPTARTDQYSFACLARDLLSRFDRYLQVFAPVIARAVHPDPSCRFDHCESIPTELQDEFKKDLQERIVQLVKRQSAAAKCVYVSPDIPSEILSEISRRAQVPHSERVLAIAIVAAPFRLTRLSTNIESALVFTQNGYRFYGCDADRQRTTTYRQYNDQFYDASRACCYNEHHIDTPAFGGTYHVHDCFEFNDIYYDYRRPLLLVESRSVARQMEMIVRLFAMVNELVMAINKEWG